MGIKKSFDTESMYKKIMPSGNPSGINTSNITNKSKSSQKGREDIIIDAADNDQNTEENLSVAQNIMAFIVRDKMNMVMEKMDCCKCDKCKADIFAQVLNKLTPKYIVGTEKELKEAAENYDPAIGLEVTTAVLHEVLALRKNPRH